MMNMLLLTEVGVGLELNVEYFYCNIITIKK